MYNYNYKSKYKYKYIFVYKLLICYKRKFKIMIRKGILKNSK